MDATIPNNPLIRQLQDIDPSLGLAVLDSSFRYLWMNEVQKAEYKKLRGKPISIPAKEPCYKLWNDFKAPCSWCPIVKSLSESEQRIHFGTVASPNVKDRKLEYSDISAIPLKYPGVTYFLEVIRVVTDRESETEQRLLSTIDKIDTLSVVLSKIREPEIFLDALLLFLVASDGLAYDKGEMYILKASSKKNPELIFRERKTIESSACSTTFNEYCKFLRLAVSTEQISDTWLKFHDYIRTEQQPKAQDIDITGFSPACRPPNRPFAIDHQRAGVFLRDPERHLTALLIVHLNPYRQLFRVDELALLSLLGLRVGSALSTLTLFQQWQNAINNIEEKYGGVNLKEMPELFMSGLQLGHDIFAPWGQIKTSIETLEAKVKTHPDPAVKMALESLRFGKRFMDMCAKLTFDSFKLKETHPGKVHPAKIAGEVVDILSMWSRESKVTIRNLIDKNLEVYADEKHVMRIFYNVGRNALDVLDNITHRSPLLEITSAVRGQFAEITFHDNGPGVRDDLKKEILRPFFTTKGEEGHGLGLSLVVDLLKENHGTLRLETVWGFWTRFIICLPFKTGNTQ